MGILKVLGYRVTIERIVEESTVDRGNWTTVDNEVVNVSTLPRHERDEEKGTILKPIYGYPPEREKIQERAIKVFEQQLESVDVGKVIIAMNT